MMLSSSGREAGPPPGKDSAEIRWAGYLAAAARGEQSALAALYDESSSLVFGVVQRILMNQADSEEVTLDVYTQIWRSAGDFTSQRGAAAGWILMLARSRALDRFRSRQRRAGQETVLDDLAPLRSTGHQPDDIAVMGQQRKMVRTALDTLVPEQRQAIELSFFSGLSHTELAEKLGQPLGTVKTRIRLGMTKLRQLLSAGKEVQ
ncbi:MAG: sigma-70 family RNA polymerase sigma factor [Acidobacteriota bacterium]